MIARTVTEHPERLALANELHARPFQPMEAPGRILHMAFLLEGEADGDPVLDHLLDFIDRFGGAHPAPGAKHYSGDLGRFVLKWERHTEFVSYSLYEAGAADQLFAGTLKEHLPSEWLAAAPGRLIAAIQAELLTAADQRSAQQLLTGKITRCFAQESIAVSTVMDNHAMIAGDFRIHEGGFTRFAVVIFGDVGPRRIGRITQRMIEIEVYRTLAMLALPVARKMGAELTEIEGQLAGLTATFADEEAGVPDSDLLSSLTALSADIEALSAGAAYRFGAGAAYEAIVHQRIEMLNEARFAGRQTFREFMLRRFDPAMRTVHSVERRLNGLSARASRIADLLRTRVDVAVETQNQQLLASMDRRAALQLRLQETVEGLSVVAISYYGVSLASYLLAPLEGVTGLDKTALTAIVTLPVIVGVWLMVRRTRRRLTQVPEDRGKP